MFLLNYQHIHLEADNTDKINLMLLTLTNFLFARMITSWKHIFSSAWGCSSGVVYTDTTIPSYCPLRCTYRGVQICNTLV